MDKKRLQFDFTVDALEELDELQRVTGLPSRAEVIRHSLRLFQWIVNETTKKSGRLIIERDGQCREIILPFLSPTTVSKSTSTTNGHKK